MKIPPLSPPPIKLKINLENIPHSVYRRVLIPGDVNMLQLHFIIQIVMGWEFAHLFQFSDRRDANIKVGLPGEFDDDFFVFGSRPRTQNADEVMLKGTFEEEYQRKPFWYWYDFGDDWWHKITFQKPTKADLRIFNGKPICVDVFGACPPEDVGGPWGYAEFLDAITNKKHPQYLEFREWAGLSKSKKYDPNYVNLDQINDNLAALFESSEWSLKAKDYFK